MQTETNGTETISAESKNMMDMMIHSIYTHKEIFLRELISNASDAIDKLYFKSLTGRQRGHEQVRLQDHTGCGQGRSHPDHYR